MLHNEGYFLSFRHHHNLDYSSLKMSNFYQSCTTEGKLNIHSNSCTCNFKEKTKTSIKTTKLIVIASKQISNSFSNLTKHFVASWAVVLFYKRLRIFFKEDNGGILFGCFRIGVAQSRITSFYIPPILCVISRKKLIKCLGSVFG